MQEVTTTPHFVKSTRKVYQLWYTFFIKSLEGFNVRCLQPLALQDSQRQIFFGGEPLLYKDLIYETVEYGTWMERKHNSRFHYKVTTNGLLLDERFMEFSLRYNIFIALSHDGIKEAHDQHRVDSEGKGTFERLKVKTELLLRERP